MKILIVSATTYEIAPLLETLEMPVGMGPHLLQCNTKANQLDILITGIGMVFTTFHLSAHLAQVNYDWVINAGVAGAIDTSLLLGEIVNVTQDYFYELGAENNDEWLSVAELGLLNQNDLPYNENGLINNKLIPFAGIKVLKQVKGHTVNKVHGNLKSIEIMRKRSNAQIESMEGGAFLYCCIKHNVSCVQLRSISNYVEPRNKDAWQMQEAIKNLNAFLIAWLVKD